MSVVDDEIQTHSLDSHYTQIPIGKGQNKQSFSASARVPSFTICSNLRTGLSSSVVHSHAVKVPVTSTHQLGPLAEQPIAVTNSSENPRYGPNKHESSCASLLAARIMAVTNGNFFFKFIVESIVEGARFAPNFD